MCKNVTFVMSFVLLLVAGVATADHTSGLVGYYAFDEGSGTIAHDMSGNGHDGTLPDSGVTWIPSAVIKGGINIDGSAPNHVKLGTWDPAEGTGQLSLALWVNWAGSGNANQGLISKRDDWNENAMMFGFRLANANIRVIKPSVQITSAGDLMNQFIGEWAHVAATFDGAIVRIYLNGEEVQSGAFTFANKTTAEMRIGASSSTSQTFNGDMDEVRIYNRVLTPDDMLDVMSPPAPGERRMSLGIMSCLAGLRETLPTSTMYISARVLTMSTMRRPPLTRPVFTWAVKAKPPLLSIVWSSSRPTTGG